MSAVPVLFDCDTGIDDAVALSYLAGLHKLGRIELVGVTTTAGNTTAEQAAVNSRFVLDELSLPEVPVVAGEPAPLVVPLVTTPETHGPHGLGYTNPANPAKTTTKTTTTPPKPQQIWQHLWKDAVDKHGDELRLVVTGPATNAAVFARQHPEVFGRIRNVTVMGGAFLYRGNTTPTAEWNCWVDPHAAKELFRMVNTPVTVCSLGVTERMLVGPDDLPGFPGFLAPMLEFYFEFHRAQGEGFQAQVHDVLACMVALDVVPFEVCVTAVDVEADSELLRGTTVADFRGHWGRPANARVVVDADVQAARRELLGVLGGLL